MKKLLFAFIVSLIFFQLSFSQVKSRKTPTWVQKKYLFFNLSQTF
jgi:hypothetical protein